MFKIYLLNRQEITEDKCEWAKLPKIPIVKIEYSFPNNRILVMEGFQAYIYIKEYYHFLYGGKGNILDTINLLGKYDKKVYQFSMNVRKGKAFQTKGEWGKEFSPLIINTKNNKFEFGKARKTNHQLWHFGMPSKNPTVYFK